MPADIDEHTPLKPQWKKPKRKGGVDPDGVWWFAALLVATLLLSYTGFLLQGYLRNGSQSSAYRVNLPQKSRVGKTGAKPAAPPLVDNFKKCNPLAAQLESVSVRGGGSLERARGRTPLLGDKCGLEEVELIRQVLVMNSYDFKRTANEMNVLNELLPLDREQQYDAILHFEEDASDKGILGSLVKLFAWGMPLNETELRDALGGDQMVQLLTRCNIVRKCGGTTMYTSNVQLFAIQNTSLIVASDWQSLQVADPNTVRLVHNVPDIQSSDAALDVFSEGGVLGLMAAARGANNVRIIQPSDKAAQFTKLSVWLSGMGNRATVYQSSLTQTTDKDKFELAKSIGAQSDSQWQLVLAHPQGPQKEDVLRTALGISRRFLSSSGMLIMGLEDQHCESFAEDYRGPLCLEDFLEFSRPSWAQMLQLYGSPKGLAGNIACTGESPFSRSSGDDHNSQQGIIYGWQATTQDTFNENLRTCGEFHKFHLNEFDSGAACQYARQEAKCSQIKESRPPVTVDDLMELNHKIMDKAK